MKEMSKSGDKGLKFLVYIIAFSRLIVPKSNPIESSDNYKDFKEEVFINWMQDLKDIPCSYMGKVIYALSTITDAIKLRKTIANYNKSKLQKSRKRDQTIRASH